MKKQFLNAIEKKVLTLLLCFIVISASVQAFGRVGEGSETKKEALVSYKGVKNKLLVFTVDYKNNTGEKFDVEIKNDANEVYYNKTFNANAVNKDIYLTDVTEKCKLTFVIKASGKQMKQSFEINPTVKTIEDYEVKELR